ncbi:SpoIIE-like protein phosphatase domain protein [Leptospira yanagawae serovar Saopaulo str. Sao Paulo = ATCC 700523]|uniref:SpoIIE-like protein phosphatase domain protein n=1 Tax=Leptospira yanagawae serovar Saopaulo str. Sao Paulo = ATCC 700523 TaxID=1249483 RepID=A0A5E8HAS1_9LEPT|nr:PP2C family protein-serine/threonine phosphatase [Leptospira yanagawae]EOQ87857.1 SpoIIE-like protein phosphatase domain protein [Leptospira yanagawae serovar Saopaulo str. Sao Paulo = ATCC 700523]
MTRSFYIYFKEIFHKPTRQEWDILKLAVPRFEKEYTFSIFLTHFIIYSLLLVPPFAEIRSDILPYLLGVTILRFILLLQFYTKTIPLEKVIYLSGFIADGLVYLVFIKGIQSIPTLGNFYLLNSYLMSFIIPILLYSTRLSPMGCIINAFYLSFFHLFYVFQLPQEISYATSIFSQYFLFFVYWGSAFLGVIFVLNKRKDTTDMYSLSEEKRFMLQELELAKRVQDALFPGNIKIPNLTFTFYRKSPNVIGGDFFDFVQLREGNVGVFLTDVAGHGISSAMVASIMKVLVSTIPYRFKTAPARLMDYLDDRLANDLNKYHASAIYLFFDFIEKKLIIGNAGHPYLILAKKDEEFSELETQGAILGFNIKIPPISEKTLPIAKGDRFFIYTDGLIESMDHEGNCLGTEGLLALLNRHRNSANVKELESNLLYELKTKFGLDTFSDDTMFLILEVEE